jgi:hypothetical protein
MDFTAVMAKEADAEMEVAYAPGGLHMALHIYDPNGGKNLTEYQIMSLPVHGRLYYSDTSPFTSPADPSAQLVSQFQVFPQIPGVALMLTYVPDEMIRGEVRYPMSKRLVYVYTITVLVQHTTHVPSLQARGAHCKSRSRARFSNFPTALFCLTCSSVVAVLRRFHA